MDVAEKDLSMPDVAEVGVVHETVRVLPDGRVARKDAAKALGLQPKTLAEWKRLGTGPKSRLVGGRAFYDWAEVQAFARGEVA
jgi:hypothetical protein